jgi:FAD/FMN-containing dehydrogenase
MLAFEPPHFALPGQPSTATLGGAVAAGLSGPRRQSVGALRDFMLGAQLMDGRGEVMDFGGQVMKNVAGYDVSRLLAGSLGTLGLILQVSVKVLPAPFDEATLRFELAQADAIEHLNRWGGQPLPLASSACCMCAWPAPPPRCVPRAPGWAASAWTLRKPRRCGNRCASRPTRSSPPPRRAARCGAWRCPPSPRRWRCRAHS